MYNKRRLVTLPTQRLGRQERTIGFDKHPVKLQDLCHLAQRGCIFERHISRKRDQKAERHEFFDHIKRSAKTMHDPTAKFLVRTFFFEYLDRLIISITAMNDDRQIEFLRGHYLSPKNILLHITGAV